MSSPSHVGGGLAHGAKGVIAAGAGGLLLVLGLLTTPPGALPLATATSQPTADDATITLGAAERKAAIEEEIKNNAWIAKAKDAIRERLRDPRSAEFRRLVVSRSGGVPMVCGEVSSRNGFGGRNGFQRVISAARPDLTFLEEEVTDIDEAWRKFC